MSVPEKHKALAPKSLGVYIITCSTSKFKEKREGKKPEDTSGDIIEELVEKSGHRVEGRELLPDSKTMLQRTVKAALRSRKIDSVIITGGTGLAPRDVTVETIKPMVEKEITGFGELFRKISHEKIGSAAMLSRAFAGITGGRAIFCLPGSPDAVRTSMDALILPELPHIIKVSRES